MPTTMETRNSKVLASFVEYCQSHPEERFWQALRNWSGYDYIWAATKQTRGWGNPSRMDTFSFEGKRHDGKES